MPDDAPVENSKGLEMSTRISGLAVGLSLVVGLVLANVVMAKGESQPTIGTAAHALALAPARYATDALPPQAQESAMSERPAGVPDQLFEGAWLTGESRRLLTVQGKWDAALYGVPTSRGWLCQVLFRESAISKESSPGGGSCVTDFSDATPIGLIVFDPDAIGAGDPVIVAGVVPSSVASIDVVVSGESHSADITNSAYAYELVNSANYPEAVVIKYTDGSIKRVAIPSPLPDPRP